ncbi:MAG: hypothetical protein LRY26_01510 [Bacilli bacterium]|nr:hypothetical protein [Bacilli bacterium]
MRLKCKVIVTPTLSGYTARKMSRFRPMCPIIALTPSDDVIKSLALSFGVYGVKIDEFENFDHIQNISKEKARRMIEHKAGDKIVITGGYPMRAGRTTNFLHIDEL